MGEGGGLGGGEEGEGGVGGWDGGGEVDGRVVWIVVM